MGRKKVDRSDKVMQAFESSKPLALRLKETAKKQFSKLKIDAYIQKDMFNQVSFIEKVKEILSKHHI